MSGAPLFDFSASLHLDPLIRLAAFGLRWPTIPELHSPGLHATAERLMGSDALSEAALADALERARSACLVTLVHAALEREEYHQWYPASGRNLLATPAAWGARALRWHATTALHQLSAQSSRETASDREALNHLRDTIGVHRAELLAAAGLGRLTEGTARAAAAIVEAALPVWPMLSARLMRRMEEARWGE